MDKEGMVAMFEALISSGLSRFLGCSSAIFETALVEFFHNASVRDGVVVSTIQGKPVAISEELFASTFALPLEGLCDLHEVPQDLILEARSAFSYDGKLVSTSCKKRELVFEFRLLNDILAKSVTGLCDLHEVPQDLILEARSAFSYDGKLVSTSCKKRELVFEFRLLNDILAKSVTVKARSFDAVTHERFLMMTAIYGGIPVNWIKILFKVLKDMVTPGSKQDRGIPSSEYSYGEAKYIAINKNIVVEDVEDEPVVKKQAEKKKAVSKKRSAHTIESPVVKRKRTTGKAIPAATDLALLPADSDDDVVEKELDVVDVGEQQREASTADDVDKIIEMILTETEQMETDMRESDMVIDRIDMDTETVLADTERSSAVNDEDDNLDGAENEIDRKMASFTASKQLLQEPLRSGEDDDMSGFKKPSKIIQSAKAEETDIEPVDIEELSLAKDVATMTESEDTGSVSKALELTVSTTFDEESMPLEDILKQIPTNVMLPSVTAVEITRIKFARDIKIPEVHEGDWRLAPTSFTKKPALQSVGGGRSSIRSTIGNVIPPSIYTRRYEGFWHGQKLLVTLIGTSPITQKSGDGGARPAGGGERRSAVA
ncbi:splicing factor 3B subunit 1-like [Dorcoceras hygrometricum]|uniref:Splicing factor 3B subunit 1-like n=1 Tax=Dorcoceras hygrometricum TaxID=472368 RepID=A0A2Z7BIC0_9LAMI|nr:splicing factor 3B subunit 1-like [Dorcoceras hygrometricum]